MSISLQRVSFGRASLNDVCFVVVTNPGTSLRAIHRGFLLTSADPARTAGAD